MTKSKKQHAAQQNQQNQQQTPGSAEDFGRSVENTFVDHPWPASRTELLEHASRQRAFTKSDFARLKRIPHRDYHSIADLMQATREVEMAGAQSPGPMASAEHNRRAMADAPAEARVSSAAPYDEQMR